MSLLGAFFEGFLGVKKGTFTREPEPDLPASFSVTVGNVTWFFEQSEIPEVEFYCEQAKNLRS